MNATSTGRKASKHLLKNLLRDDGGATMIEYGLIAGFIGIIVLTFFSTIGEKIRDGIFGAIVTALASVVG